MTAAAFRRLTAMQPEELRFRLTCQLRKTAGRIRTAISTSRWDRSGLPRALRGGVRESNPWQAAIAALHKGDYRAAHLSFGEHFAARTSPFPLNARHANGLADLIGNRFPDAAADSARRADHLVQGRYDLLGHRGLALGTPPDWHMDAVHRRQSPRIYWAAVPYLDPAVGDHKVIWELNRHQHWLTLGRAYALNGDERCYREFTTQLASWLAANPPLVGTNWASALELALRSISWLWALELFAGAAGTQDDEPWLVDLLLGLDRQLTHIEHNLSYYFSPNTHLTGEALALYVAGLSLPQFRSSARRATIGRSVLVREASRQIRSDGGHVELSAHYHRYSTDFYLLAASVARRAADPAARLFEEAARSQVRYLRSLSDHHGYRPAIGDDDGGQLFPMCGRAADDCTHTLATAAVLLDEPGLAIGPVPEETYWMCGERAQQTTVDTVTRWASIALPSSGYFVSRTPRGDHLIFDAGPHGYLNGGHAHADALSCTLAVNGRPLLVDAGTATYTMDAKVRDRFRSTMMHNTIALEGRSQSEPRGPFHWKSRTSAHAQIWRSSHDCDYVEGTHEAYAPRRHTRGILAIHGVGWWIVDHILGPGTTRIEPYWHIHPSWECSLDTTQHVCRLRNGPSMLALASSAPLELLAQGRDPLAVWSQAYGVIEPSPVARASVTTALPATISTFIPASSDIAELLAIEPVLLEAPPEPEWHAAAFRVRWSKGAMVLLSAVERWGLATRDGAAPSGRWGTVGLRTNARVAALIDRAAGPSEAIMVNGAFLAADPGHPFVSLSGTASLLRSSAPRLAPSMHEVAGVWE